MISYVGVARNLVNEWFHARVFLLQSCDSIFGTEWGPMRSFFIRAFYLLQEIAGLRRLASLKLVVKPPSAWFGITSPLIERNELTTSSVVAVALANHLKHIHAHFPMARM